MCHRHPAHGQIPKGPRRSDFVGPRASETARGKAPRRRDSSRSRVGEERQRRPAPSQPTESRSHSFAGPKGVTRRDVLKVAAAAAGLVALGPIKGIVPTAYGAPLTQKRLVVINLFGGHDTMNMVIPHTLTPYYERRAAMAIQASDALSLAAGPGTSAYVLHPRMTATQALWNDGDVAIVQRVGYPSANLSHFISQDIFSRCVRDRFPAGIPSSGWIARYADRNAPTPLGAVSLGVGRPLDFVGGSTNPFLVSSLGGFRLNGGSGTTHLHRAGTAADILSGYAATGTTKEARDALDQAYQLADQVQDAVADYSSSVNYTYVDPDTGKNTTPAIARRLQDVARLVQAGFETRIFFTGYGGFDTHGGQLSRHATLLTQLDRSIGAFAADMKAMGVWEDMVLCVITEFGRRNFVNGSDGTDHGHAYCELLIGGGVQGGAYGPDLTEADLNRNYPLHAVDFRDVYAEVLDGHMGAGDLDYVLPENTTASPLGLV